MNTIAAIYVAGMAVDVLSMWRVETVQTRSFLGKLRELAALSLVWPAVAVMRLAIAVVPQRYLGDEA